jgi:hypothetical protein
MTNKVRVDTKKLNSILKSVDGETLAVIIEIADAVVRDAKSLAPVDEGDLRDSIYRRTAKENNMPALSGDVNRVELPAPETPLSVSIGPSVDYGIVIELGSTTHSARPYLSPAFRKHASRIESYRRKFGKAVGDGK